MDSKKRKKHFYKPLLGKKKTKYLVLRPGLKGFLCTCNNREKECIREAFNILNEYGDKLYGSEHESDLADKVEGESDDIEAEFNRELKNLQAATKNQRTSRRFNLLSSKVHNCIFVQTQLPDPVELVRYIINDLDAKQKQRTMFLLRMMPVEVTCKASICDIEDAAKELFKKYFVQEGKTFAILLKKRNNSTLIRDEVIQSLAGIVLELNPLNRADLKQPELAVLVEVVCNICCLSVAPDYFKFCKYNLLEICSQKVKSQSKNQLEEIVKQNTDPAVEMTKVEEILGDIDNTSVKITSEEIVNIDQIVKQDTDDPEVKIANCKESVNVEEIIKQEADTEVNIANFEKGVNVEEIGKQGADTEVNITNFEKGVNVEEIVKQEADTEVNITNFEKGVNVEEIVKQMIQVITADTEVKTADCKESVNVEEIAKQEADDRDTEVNITNVEHLD